LKNSIIYQVQQLLSRNKIVFDKEELSFQIQSHPSYPSIHAVTGVLDHFNIDNLALDVPSTKEVFLQLPTDFLGQIKTDKGDDFAIITKKKETIVAHFSSKDKRILSQNEFLHQFTGVLVAVENDNQNQFKSKKDCYQ